MPVIHYFIAIQRKSKGNYRTVAMLSAYTQLIYSLSNIYMIFYVALHYCGTVKYVAMGPFLSYNFT
jgi:hypothetical protein